MSACLLQHWLLHLFFFSQKPEKSTLPNSAGPWKDFSFVLYSKHQLNTKSSVQSKRLTLCLVFLSNAYPEKKNFMIFSTTAWIQWLIGTKEANHNIEMKLHNKFMSTFKTRRSRKLHLPDYVTGLTSTLFQAIIHQDFQAWKLNTQKFVCLPYARSLGWNSFQCHLVSSGPSLAKRWHLTVIHTVTEPGYIPGLVLCLRSVCLFDLILYVPSTIFQL